MKAIVNVNNKSSHAIHNGMTYEVVELLTTGNKPIVSLNINGITTDFTVDEVMICDIQKEAQKAYDDMNWYGRNGSNWNEIKAYMLHKFIVFTPEYNCPA